jgi:hypothetical protein
MPVRLLPTLLNVDGSQSESVDHSRIKSGRNSSDKAFLSFSDRNGCLCLDISFSPMFCFGPLSVPYRRGKSSRPWVHPGSGTTNEKIRLRERSRSHHIYPYTPSSSLFLPPRRDGGVLGGNGAWKGYLVVLSPASASTSHAVFSCVKQKRLQRKVIGKYDFSASFLEPSLPRGGSSTKGGATATVLVVGDNSS